MKQEEMLCVEIVRGHREAIQLANKYKEKGYKVDATRDEQSGKFCVFANVNKNEWYVANSVNDYSDRI